MRYAVALAMLAGLAACATVPSAPEALPFDLLGRVFVGYDGPAYSSNVRWQHKIGHDEIWLMTPLGQTIAHIVASRYSATLTAANQEEYHAASVESLTRSALGWELPVTLLRYWVQGEVAAGSAPSEVKRGPDGRLVGLSQDGWRITFTHSASPGERHPHRLVLTNGSQQIRLVIDRWQSGAS